MAKKIQNLIPTQELDFHSVLFRLLLTAGTIASQMYDPSNRSNFVGVSNFRYSIEFMDAFLYPWHSKEYRRMVAQLDKLGTKFSPSDSECVDQLFKKQKALMWLLFDRKLITQEFHKNAEEILLADTT